jgi:hypothetical protein
MVPCPDSQPQGECLLAPLFPPSHSWLGPHPTAEWIFGIALVAALLLLVWLWHRTVELKRKSTWILRRWPTK